MNKLITKSFKRLLDKGIHRGFITYEELGKSLGKRHFSQENLEKAFLYIFDNKICLVEKDVIPFLWEQSFAVDLLMLIMELDLSCQRWVVKEIDVSALIHLKN